VRDVRGLRLTPDADLADAPQLDLLHIPGGYGQEAFMDDEELLGWVRKQAAGAKLVFSVCTGASSAGRRGCSKVAGRRRIGRRFTCCPISAQFP
jgi:cyclohexyl-isocyanide hydratase